MMTMMMMMTIIMMTMMMMMIIIRLGVAIIRSRPSFGLVWQTGWIWRSPCQNSPDDGHEDHTGGDDDDVNMRAVIRIMPMMR